MSHTEFRIHGHTLNVTCSVGISVYPENGLGRRNPHQARRAAMYIAKRNGTNKFELFTEDLSVQMVERLRMESGLRLALEKQEFFLVLSTADGDGDRQYVGVEALLRWQHPELGLVPPDKFIPIARTPGSSVPIGEWVLRTACTQARKWQIKVSPPCRSRSTSPRSSSARKASAK